MIRFVATILGNELPCAQMIRWRGGKNCDMMTIGRAGIVMATSLSLLLVAGCAESDKYLTLNLGGGVTMDLVHIETDTFTMGSPTTEKGHEKWESPQHEVTLSTPFYMGVTEVTQAQWEGVMNTQPWEGQDYTKAGADYAASYISWDDATTFCTALSKKIGRTVRLPTEAEWEYACRAGTTTAYNFGDDSSKLGDYAWYNGNTWRNTWDTGEAYAPPVGVKKPNAWGLSDMHGNVCEWCSDWHADLYANVDVHNPKGPATGESRVLRGGSWISGPNGCRTASRGGAGSDDRLPYNGLRVVVEIGSGVD